MIVLDTTVLVYATGGDHPLRGPARAIVAALGRDAFRATTTVEVLQEFAYVRARRSGRDEATGLAELFQTLLSPLTVASETDLASGLKIWQATPPLGAFDAVLAATARAHTASLLSADRAFSLVPGLDHVLLDDTSVSRLGAD